MDAHEVMNGIHLSARAHAQQLMPIRRELPRGCAEDYAKAE